MESYKQEKIIIIMYEYLNDKREFYPISNVPLDKAKFFYKDDDGLFKLMAVSDYTVKTELNENRLYIVNAAIKDNSEKFQIGYEINFKAAEYESPLPVLSVLTKMYNQLIEDTRILHSYIRKQCFVADGKEQALVLPGLPAHTVWCMGENGKMFALPVSELYEKFQELIDTIYKEIKKILDVDYTNLSDELRKKTDKLLKELEDLKKQCVLDITKEGEKQLEILNQASAGLPKRVTALENKTTQDRKKLEDLINTARTENIQSDRIPSNSLSARKLKIGADADKIKLENLSDEVKKAMTGNTSVSPTLNDNSVVREYIADGAINDDKIDGLGISLRGITKSLENNIFLEKANGGANILNGKYVKTAVIDNNTLALNLTYQNVTGYDGVMFDNNKGLFEIRCNNSVFAIIGSNKTKDTYYTFSQSGKTIQIGKLTTGYSTIKSIPIAENLSFNICKFKIIKNKIIIYNTENNDSIAYEITPNNTPEIAEAFENPKAGMMVWGAYNSSTKISLFTQYLENSNLNTEINNFKKEIDNFKDNTYFAKKELTSNKDITLSNQNAVTIGAETVSYSSSTNETIATKKAGANFVFLGYKCHTMDIYLKDFIYLLVGISSKNEDEVYLYQAVSGKVLKFKNSINDFLGGVSFGKPLTEYVKETKLTCSYENGILKIYDSNNVYADGNLLEAFAQSNVPDEFKDYLVAFGKRNSPIRADFINGKDISIKNKVLENVNSIKETNTRITNEVNGLNTRIDSIVTSGGLGDNSVDVVLFMGQSNMAGRGVASEAPVVPKDTAYEFRAISDPIKLYQIVEPFGFNEDNPNGINDRKMKTGSMVSSLVNEYYKYTGRKIVAISASEGGTMIATWTSNKYLSDIKSRLESTLNYLQSQNIKVKDIFMVWCQGESDESTPKDDYKTKFNKMWSYMKDTLNISKCFLVRIGYFNEINTPNKYSSIIEAQREICEYSDDIILASTRFDSMQSEGLMKDEFHYKQEGYNLTGAEAGRNIAYYLKTGRKPSFYDWHYNDIYVPKYGSKKK